MAVPSCAHLYAVPALCLQLDIWYSEDRRHCGEERWKWIREEERLTGWGGWACERAPLQKFYFKHFLLRVADPFLLRRKCVFTILSVTFTTVYSKVRLARGENCDDVQSSPKMLQHQYDSRLFCSAHYQSGFARDWMCFNGRISDLI